MLLDGTIFSASSGGTSDFTVSSAVSGYMTPAGAGAVDGRPYSYRAQSTDLSQWEIGIGVYRSGTTKIERTDVLYNSSGTTSKINFSAAPQVHITPLKRNFGETINIFDYLTATEQANVLARNGSSDVTSAITAAIADIPSGGGNLHFPKGKYPTTGGFTLANPFKLTGDGFGHVDGSAAISEITCSSSSAVLFTATADYGLFRDIGLRCTHATPTSASKLIYINGSDELQKVDIDSCLLYGSYNQIDMNSGSSWVVRNNTLVDATHWAIKVGNSVNPDAGDALITGNWIYPDGTGGALAGIKWEGSGGLKIISNKIISNDGTHLAAGIHFNCSPSATVEWNVSNNHIDVANVPIRLEASPTKGVIVGNVLNSRDGTSEAIKLEQAAVLVISANIMTGGSSSVSPITFGNVQDLTVLPQQTKDYSSTTLKYLGTGTPSNIRDMSRVNTWNTLDPANAKATLSFSNGNLTVSATATNASGACVRALNGGFTQNTYFEAKFTTIGSAGGSGVGVMTEDQDPHLGHYLGDTGNDSIGYYGDGNVWRNGSSVATISTYTTNDVISVFVNFAKKLIFFRKNAGNWNNNAAADPETGANGIDISALFQGTKFFPAIDIESSTGVCVVNFGASAYAQTPPDNCGNW